MKLKRFDQNKYWAQILCEEKIQRKEFRNKKSELFIYIITDFVLSGFRNRMQKAHADWIVRNNSSLEWNEWARRNPSKARDICLEAEYFYGDGLILPRSWDDAIEEWKKTKICNCENDDGKYKPKILDEPKTGPIGLAGLGFVDKINQI